MTKARTPKVTAVQKPKPSRQVAVAARSPMKVSDQALARAKGRRRRMLTDEECTAIFEPAVPPPGVVPKGHSLAMDSAVVDIAAWGGAGLYSYGVSQGMTFLGYPLLSEMAQRPEFRRISEVMSTEMTRKWIKLHAKGDEDKSDKIAEIETEMKRLGVQAAFREVAEQDGFFGRSHLYLDLGSTDKRDELRTPIGDGRNKISQAKVKKGDLKRIKTVEAVWCYPAQYNANDPLKPDWYKPSSWFVMGKEVHASRLLTFVGREVPDLLKPAFSFGGLSLSQMAKPYVDNWIRTRQSVSDLVSNFSVSGIKTNMAATLQAGGDDMFKRLDLFNALRDNSGAMMLDKDTEDWFNISTPLTTLDALQAQSQEHIAAVCGIPLIKLLGISPAGLNACLPGDTLITTDRGQVKIRDVTTADMVLTRGGWAPLTFAGITKYAMELIEIRTASKTLLCTGNHPIWLPSAGDFVPAENVRHGDRLLLIGENSGTQKMRPQFHGEANGGGDVGTATMLHGMRNPAVQFSSIGEFGRRMSGLCRREFISTIEMAIRPIISSTILNHCWRAITPNFITLTLAHDDMSVQRTEFASTARQRSWFKSFRAGKSFALTNAFWPIAEKIDRRQQDQDRYAHVFNAVTSSSQAEGARNFVRASVQPLAVIGRRIATHIISRIQKNMCGQKHKNSDESLIVSVRRVPSSEWVYDLTVAPGYLPEFYANGILTHNSSDGEIRVFYDWIAAYQERFFATNLHRLLGFIQLSLWGKVDEDISATFEPLWSLDEAALAGIRKTDAETGQILIDSGAISPEEERRRVAEDPDTPYAGLDPEDMPDLLEEEEEGGIEPKGGRPDPEAAEVVPAKEQASKK